MMTLTSSTRGQCQKIHASLMCKTEMTILLLNDIKEISPYKNVSMM
jgi:hypothetical protein